MKKSIFFSICAIISLFTVQESRSLPLMCNKVFLYRVSKANQEIFVLMLKPLVKTMKVFGIAII